MNKDKISIVRADSSHLRLIWEWRNDPQTIYMSRNAQPISLDLHSKWFHNVISEELSYIYVLIWNNVPVGMARFDLLENNINACEISINLGPDFRNQGLSKILLSMSINKFKNDIKEKMVIYAEIKKENMQSIQLFSKYGFSLMTDNGTMNKYIYQLD